MTLSVGTILLRVRTILLISWDNRVNMSLGNKIDESWDKVILMKVETISVMRFGTMS